MNTARKTIAAFATVAIIAVGSFAASTQQAEAGSKGKYFLGGLVAGAIISNAARHAHGHGHYHCHKEKRLVKVGYNTYKKKWVKTCH